MKTKTPPAGALGFDVARLPRELQRTEVVQTAQPARYTPARAAAEALTRRGMMAAKAELCNTALLGLTELCFEMDTDGQRANVDPDGRVLIPLPWGRLGGKAWGLRASEQRALRVIIQQRAAAGGDPLYTWDADGRAWLLNLAYSKQTAGAYLRSWPVTTGEYRAAAALVATGWAPPGDGADRPVAFG